MSDHDDFGAFLIGFVVGGLAGAVAALLLAPQSGEETRALIKDKSIELRDKATDTAGKARIKVDEFTSDAKVRGKEFVDSAKSRGKDLVDGAKKAVAKKRPEEPATE